MMFYRLFVTSTGRLTAWFAASALALLVIVNGCSEKDDSEGDHSTTLSEKQVKPVKPIVGEESEPATAAKPNPDADDALRQACAGGLTNAVRAALKIGADVNAPDETGWTAFGLAAFSGHDEIVSLLLDRGAKVNQRDPMGRTALIFAASGPSSKTVEILLAHGAEVDAREQSEQFTALMFAAAEGQTENVKLLLGHGADPSLKDIDGDTAADFAQDKGHTAIVRLLRQGPQR